MKARIAFLRRDDNGDVIPDGIELDPCFDGLDHLPRIGDSVTLLPSWQKQLQPEHPLPVKRMVVMDVVHRWASVLSPLIDIYIAVTKEFHRAQQNHQKHNEPQPARKTPWQIATDWYKEEEIARSITCQRSQIDFGMDPIPENVDSSAFARWMTHQYRLAMAKGIELARE